MPDDPVRVCPRRAFGRYGWTMQRLLVCAIAIDDVRDFFRADAALAARLRGIAAKRFAAPHPPKRRLFAPLTRKDPNVVADKDTPDGADLTTLLSGGFVAPERMAPSWRLLTAWLEDVAKVHRYVVWDGAAFNTLEWELARAGLNSDYSLHSLADRELGLQLRPLPDQVAGYAKHVHIVDAYPALKQAVQRAELEPADQEFVEPLLAVAKVAASSPDLDVVIVGCE